MSIDSNSISINTKGSSTNNINDYLAKSAGGYLQFDPAASNLASFKDYNYLPDNVKIVLNATGVFSLNPIDGWTKTVLNDNLAKAFGGQTIYTPPISTIDFFNSLRIQQSDKGRFDDFLSTVFYEQVDDYSNSSETNPLAALLNYDSFQK